MHVLEIRKLSPESIVPTRCHPGDAGLDLYGIEDVTLEPGQTRAIATGIALAIPAGHVGLVADRSSMAARGLTTAGGVIDAGYRGEVRVVIMNLSSRVERLKPGDRIAQLLVLPVALPEPREAKSLPPTSRGAGGFGSTGA